MARSQRSPLPPRGEREPLDVYLSEIGSIPTLSRDQERALARTIQECEGRWRDALLRVPGIGSAVHERWLELREAGRTSRSLAEEQSEADDDGVRATDHALDALARLLRERARARRGPARERVDARIHRLLLELRPSLRLLEQLQRRIAADVEAWARAHGVAPALLRERLEAASAAFDALGRARAEFVRANVKLVVHVAKQFPRWALSLDDLIQEGNLGLLRAVEKFDWRREVRFSSYAVFWIKQSVRRAIQYKARTVRVPARIEDMLVRARRIEMSAAGAEGLDLGTGELAARLGASADDERGLAVAQRVPLSLDAPGPGEDSDPFGWSLADPEAEDPVALVEHAELRGDLLRLLRDLRPRLRQVIERRYGLDGEPSLSLERMGQEMGVTRERVRQLEADALDKLRALARERGLAAHL
jgi:RNA polymerase primary sigma factor